MRDHNRPTILESGLFRSPGPARRAAPQRLNHQSDLISGLERLVRPAVPGQAVGTVSFEPPDHRTGVRALHLEEYERVGAAESVFPHDAHHLYRVVPIKHCDRMM